ncbi:chemotaxis protein CheA [Altererythrobacter soli]|uniref:Chemotaxis protein CheA n=1 Tax=Croceibacterium soli TaxID=1739690 RepID=A0A6I4UW88_9SPHN|nr:chemotaxis protein CheA [Croceibacterium soli]MXP42134.1 chemotaxis protein CheA [Croceibacterium soli]
MDDLLAEFLAESRDMLEALSGEIVAWENDPGDRERLDAIFRFVHTVKGNCGFFEFPRLEALSHAAEDALADVRAGRRQPDQALVSAVLAVIDRIAAIVEAIGAGAELPEQDDAPLVAALSAHEDEVSPLAAARSLSASQSRRQSVMPRTIRLPVQLLDRVMSGVSDMAVARNDLARRLAQHDGETGLEGPFNRLSAIIGDLREAITRIRMQPIETLFSGFPRLVRDLSQELGKQVMVEVESGEVEIDREMIEVVRDPLVHLIRNAVDHGIESPADRRAAGKREIGLLQISARQTGSEIRIGIVDDGRGIDGGKLVQKAVAAGLLTAGEAALLSDRERNALICEPGLSTASEITAVSGRGVGMDVVRANIEKIGGSLTIDSTPGAGTRMILNVPLTLSIVPSLTVAVAGRVFAIPRSYVEEIVRASDEEMGRASVGGREFVTVRGERLPCIGLGEVLDLGQDPGASRLYVLLRLVGGDTFGLAVDEVRDHEELVVKPIPPVLMACGLYVGSTQLDDGSPIPMLDISGIAQAAGMIHDMKNRPTRRGRGEAQADERTLVPALLFRGFDGGERAVEMDAVRRIEKLPVAALRTDPDGGSQIVIEGRIVALASFGPLRIEGETINLFRTEAEGREIAWAYAEIVDLCEFDPAEVVAGARRKLALIGGRPVELYDSQALLAHPALLLPAEG